MSGAPAAESGVAAAARARVRARGLGVRFQFDATNRSVTPALSRVLRRGDVTWGLRELDLDIGPGEGVALIGPSGSGKTTLLRALAGVMPVDAGLLEVSGHPAALLATDAGLIDQLTGRENAHLLAVLAGLGYAQARASLGEVAEAGRLGDAFERPVATYSEGMRGRLALSVAETAEHALLLLDEVYEALDHEFRGVVEAHAEALRVRGGIVIAAGHDHAALRRLCDRALLMERGRVVADGSFEEIVRRYLG